MLFSYAKGFSEPFITLRADWPDFVDMLHELSLEPRHVDRKETSACFGSFILKQGECFREKKNIDRMSSFAAFDLDIGGWFIEDIVGVLDGLEFVAHTTTKSSYDMPRWRVIIKLDREHSTAEHYSVWHFFNDLFMNYLDPKTSDFSRIYFRPHDWEGGESTNYRMFHHQQGFEFPVDAAVAQFQPQTPVLPVSAQSIGAVSRPALRGIIQPWNASRFRTSPKGGRFYDMMVRAAIEHRQNNWMLNATDLANAALAVSPNDASGPRKNTVSEAEHAIGWAQQNFKVLTPMEKMRALHARQTKTRK